MINVLFIISSSSEISGIACAAMLALSLMTLALIPLASLDVAALILSDFVGVSWVGRRLRGLTWAAGRPISVHGGRAHRGG